ncbi:MarR family winged helix-turn-helix transcriptional regulator [Pseudomonas putida]
MCIDSKITSVQTSTLSILLEQGPISLSQVGELASMDLATTRGVVDRLKGQELITLVKGADDKRKVIACLTEKGKNYIEAMLPVMDEILDKTLEPLNPAERLAFEFLIRKILAADSDQQMLSSNCDADVTEA